MLTLVIGLILFRQKFKQNQDDLREKRGNSSWKLRCFHNLSFGKEDIAEALQDKENVIGTGGSGKVYRVDLQNNVTVAVKQLCPMNMNNNKENGLSKLMKAEVDILGLIRHKNIVKLYCCLSNGNSNLLVYEYMQNGSLFDALHKTHKDKTSNGSGFYLDWPTRYKIALGAAHGLAYLHHDCSPPIVHRDVKSTNILLGEFFEAKIADFGIAKILQVGGGRDSITAFAGTHGYIAPEYAYSYRVTEKSDIYSFGVVLLELVTGKQPIEPEFGENNDIVYWISRKICTRQDALEVLDSRISKSYEEEMYQVLKIAVRCTYKLPAPRPRMREVIQMLLDADPCNFKTTEKEKKSKNTSIIIDSPARETQRKR
uniref:Protein kinase domain-containing protein n=1 Tax=Araucaria cunninghamii TaxID=56994 RepID=A0A0D6QYM3_ARACU